MNPMKMTIAVVTSRFNEELTSKMAEGAVQFLEDFEHADIEIWSVSVPGAIEIPLACKALIEKGADGVVALGAVIRGETSHYDVVCNSVERGVTHLMLETGRPIGLGVLTTENEEQAWDRVGGQHGHKGIEAAQVTVEMVGLIKSLKTAGKRTQTVMFKPVKAPPSKSEVAKRKVKKKK
ncbi:MAG: 6,7-dimethyl-8-ribityllumazine synthase [Bdellovibrio sp.]